MIYTQAHFDWDYGLHSNIPPCCVLFFIDRSRLGHAHLNAMMKQVGLWYKNGFAKPHYVPCPTCAVQMQQGVREPNELHRCHPLRTGCLELHEKFQYCVDATVRHKEQRRELMVKMFAERMEEYMAGMFMASFRQPPGMWFDYPEPFYAGGTMTVPLTASLADIEETLSQ